jgi:hypothetical protein
LAPLVKQRKPGNLWAGSTPMPPGVLGSGVVYGSFGPFLSPARTATVGQNQTSRNASHRMIDWKVTVGGQLPPDWESRRDGCWFPDFEMQHLLLPHFDVGDQPIDEYGKTIFESKAVARLRTHLSAYRSQVEAQPESWSITERSSRGERIFLVDREAVLAVIDKTLVMIEHALSRGGELIFFGD